jgi:hypothetical protein
MKRAVANALMNIGWSLLGLLCGTALGYYHAYLTVGANPNRGSHDLLEAIAVRPIVGAVLGTTVGAIVAWARSGHYAFLAAKYGSEPWYRKLPAEAIIWLLLILGVVCLFLLSPELQIPAE